MAAKRKPDLDELLEQIAGLPTEQQQELLQKVNMRLSTPKEQESDGGLASFFNKVAKIRESISDEDLAKLPTDGARNYKHYLYGHPKEA